MNGHESREPKSQKKQGTKVNAIPHHWDYKAIARMNHHNCDGHYRIKAPN
ncbi:hypothetical protein [Diaphorobacter sp.]|nr:hypothetical protein [Diaphorobacter sp.]